MAKAIKSSKEIRTALLAVLTRIFECSLNHWYDVTDLSIPNLIIDSGLPAKYIPFVMRKLTDGGLIYREGTRHTMRFKITAPILPDLPELTNDILSDIALTTKKYNDKYRLKTENQTNHKKTSLHNHEPQNSKPIKEQQKVLTDPAPVIGSIRYLIHQNRITEVRVYAIFENTDQTIVFDVSNFNTQNEPPLLTITNVKQSSLFVSVEKLLLSLSKRLVKNHKRTLNEMMVYPHHFEDKS